MVVLTGFFMTFSVWEHHSMTGLIVDFTQIELATVMAGNTNKYKWLKNLFPF